MAYLDRSANGTGERARWNFEWEAGPELKLKLKLLGRCRWRRMNSLARSILRFARQRIGSEEADARDLDVARDERTSERANELGKSVYVAGSAVISMHFTDLPTRYLTDRMISSCIYCGAEVQTLPSNISSFAALQLTYVATCRHSIIRNAKEKRREASARRPPSNNEARSRAG